MGEERTEGQTGGGEFQDAYFLILQVSMFHFISMERLRVAPVYLAGAQNRSTKRLQHPQGT